MGQLNEKSTRKKSIWICGVEERRTILRWPHVEDGDRFQMMVTVIVVEQFYYNDETGEIASNKK